MYYSFQKEQHDIQHLNSFEKSKTYFTNLGRCISMMTVINTPQHNAGAYCAC